MWQCKVWKTETPHQYLLVFTQQQQALSFCLQHEANMQNNLQTRPPPPLRLWKCRCPGAPGAPAGPDWFSNKEWTAAPGTLGNCHICHPKKRSWGGECEQLLSSNWTELSDAEQRQRSGVRRWSISCSQREWGVVKRDRETLRASHTCINSHTSS